jgi:hypothetical protein
MSGVSVRFSDLVKQYDGTGDFAEWVLKLELVARLQKVGDLQDFLPLFLSGGAFAVYQSLDVTVRGDYDLVKGALTAAFSVNAFTAFEQFITRRLQGGEAVDVFLADLTRLAMLVTKSAAEEWVKCAFVAGLPNDVRKQLQASCLLATMKLAEVVDKARSLVSSTERCFASINTAAGYRKPVRRSGGVMCFTCKKEGHMSRDCSQRTQYQRKCFVCDEPGHFAVSCPVKLMKEESQAKNV